MDNFVGCYGKVWYTLDIKHYLILKTISNKDGEDMNKFPNLNIWFDTDGYYEHHKCKAITLLLKEGLHESDLEYFCKEFAKLICRIRCNNYYPYGEPEIDLCLKCQDVIDGNDILSLEESIHLARIVFFNGLISDKKFRKTGNYYDSIDRDNFNGYFGEVLFYILREQYLEDEKIMIEPIQPKEYSKKSGLDYIEIRKSDGFGFYFIIGEVKTTKNTIGSYPIDITNALVNRSPALLNAEVNAFKERVKNEENEELKYFVDRINISFEKNSEEKRYSGVINYGRNSKHQDTVFKNFYNDCSMHLSDSVDCRKIKLIGIKDIENIKERVLKIIWTTLLA